MPNKLIAFSSISPNEQIKINRPQAVDTQEKTVNFKDVFRDALNKVNEAENKSNLTTEAFMQGKISDMHQVMLTAQKAKLTVEATVQIQQKVLDAYNDIMRMQV